MYGLVPDIEVASSLSSRTVAMLKSVMWAWPGRGLVSSGAVGADGVTFFVQEDVVGLDVPGKDCRYIIAYEGRRGSLRCLSLVKESTVIGGEL